jgi:hypothetical protein
VEYAADTGPLAVNGMDKYVLKSRDESKEVERKLNGLSAACYSV